MRMLVLISIFLYACNTQAAEIRVATAANFYPTLKKIKNEFEKITQHKVTIIRGSTGKLFAQIVKGAPYDIFLSADSERADKLVTLGKSFDNKSYVYAIGQLALWEKGASKSADIKNKLFKGQFKKLAIANPKTAPYGYAAIETLKAMKIYEQVKPRLVYGENISQALQFVESGAADIGFVAKSYVIDDVYWDINNRLYKPIKQKMLLLKQVKDPVSAQDFMRFMQSEKMRALIIADGYLL